MVGADPGVDCLAVGFAQGAGVVVPGADVRGDGGSVDADAVGVGAGDYLFVRSKDAVDESGVVGWWDFAMDREAAEVVYAFKDDEVADAGLGEDVAIETGKGVGAEAVGEEMVAADAGVGDAESGYCVLGIGCRCWLGVWGVGSRVWGGRERFGGLQAGGEDVWPAVVAVGGCAVSVGDGVAEGYDGGGWGVSADIDGGDLVPVINLFDFAHGCLFGRVEFGGGDGVAVYVIRGGAGAGVAGLDGGRLVEMDADGEVGEGGDWSVDWIGEDFSAGRDGEVWVPGER